MIVRELDFIKVKGKSKPVIIYELVAIREGPLARAIPERKAGVMEAYAQGRRRYLNRQFALAIGMARRWNSTAPTSPLPCTCVGASTGCRNRPESWDGSWQMQEK